MKLTFGKYKGLDLKDVDDIPYLTWVIKNVTFLNEDYISAIGNRVAKLSRKKTDLGLEYKTGSGYRTSDEPKITYNRDSDNIFLRKKINVHLTRLEYLDKCLKEVEEQGKALSTSRRQYIKTLVPFTK